MTNPMIEREEPVVHDPDIVTDEHRIESEVLHDILDKATYDAVMLISLTTAYSPYQTLRLLVMRGYKDYIKAVESEETNGQRTADTGAIEGVLRGQDASGEVRTGTASDAVGVGVEDAE